MDCVWLLGQEEVGTWRCGVVDIEIKTRRKCSNIPIRQIIWKLYQMIDLLKKQELGQVVPVLPESQWLERVQQIVFLDVQSSGLWYKRKINGMQTNGKDGIREAQLSYKNKLMDFGLSSYQTMVPVSYVDTQSLWSLWYWLRCIFVGYPSLQGLLS